MNKDYFYFKKFKLKQNNTAMKVGTDGVILGAYIDCEDAETILDIGTGIGLIAIMLAQKSKAIIDAIDITQESILLAQENINMCSWNDRISLKKIDLQNFFPDQKYDLIVCNPPFYTTDIVAPYKNRAVARHSLFLNFYDLAFHSSRLLSEKGKLYVIYPIKQAELFATEAQKQKMFKISELFIKPNLFKSPVRIIMGFSKSFSPKVSKTISIENYRRHDYSKEYREITKDYYVSTFKNSK